MMKPYNTFILTIVLLLSIISTSVSAHSQINCRYEARVRVGIVWYNVDVLSPANASRSELIYRLSRLYNFVDVGNIYKISNTCK